ncbi:MAG: hypothetical protein ACRCWF_16515 [Beijerinckiaceae bacterium]
MIEQSLYFSLGFLVAALLAMAILPAFWRRAYRLTRREIETTLPLSPQEIAAERDQLRAKFAVERRQLEQKVEATLASRQLEMKATGNKTIAIADLENTLVLRQNDITHLNSQMTDLGQQLANSQDVLAKTAETLTTTGSNLDHLSREHEQLLLNHRDLQALSDQRRVEIAAHQTNLEAQRARIDELDTRVKKTQAELKTTTEALRAAERSLRESTKDNAILSRKIESADDISERRAAIIAERDSAIDALKQEGSALYKAGKDMEGVVRDEARKLATAEKQLKERDVTIAKMRDESRQIATDLSGSIDKLRADRLKLTTELSEMRSKASLLQRELNAIKRGSGVTDLRAKAGEMTTLK